MHGDERDRDAQSAAAGNAEALQRLIVHYHATLHGVVAREISPRLRRRLDPDDVLQQAYVAAFEHLGNRPAAIHGEVRVDGGAGEANAGPALGQSTSDIRFNSPGAFYKWLERVALNQLLDMQRALRRQKRDVAREALPRLAAPSSYPDLLARLTAGDGTPSAALRSEEAVAALLTALARLKPNQRTVIRRRFLENQPVAAIAAELGKTDTAVYTLCHRGLKALRARMGVLPTA